MLISSLRLCLIVSTETYQRIQFHDISLIKYHRHISTKFNTSQIMVLYIVMQNFMFIVWKLMRWIYEYLQTRRAQIKLNWVNRDPRIDAISRTTLASSYLPCTRSAFPMKAREAPPLLILIAQWRIIRASRRWARTDVARSRPRVFVVCICITAIRSRKESREGKRHTGRLPFVVCVARV